MTTKQKTRKQDRHANQTDGVVQKLKSKTLLGEIITLGSRSGTTSKHKDVITALKAAGLDEKVAREFAPKHAFTRACRKLAEDGVIDSWKKDGEYLVFQFSKRKTTDAGIEYHKDEFIKLHEVKG